MSEIGNVIRGLAGVIEIPSVPPFHNTMKVATEFDDDVVQRNKKFAQQIKDAWRKCGYEVSVWWEERPIDYHIRSELINGVPPRND